MNRPMALVCYICGRQFGTKSLGIHIKSCQQKWENQQNQKLPKQRRPCPQSPPGLHQLLSKDKITKQDIMRFNNGSFNTFMEEALVQCEYCGRKFNQKSLVPHQKACMKQPMIRKHYVKKEERQSGNNNMQLKINDNFEKSYQNPSKLNDNTYQNFSKSDIQPVNQNLVPCHKCGRTFNPDRVAKHQKVCKQTKEPKVSKIQSKVNQVNSTLKPNMAKNKGPLNEKPAKWKTQHEQLQNAMKAMREMKRFQQKGGDIRTLPPPPPSNYDHYVQCKYCGRKYAAEVAQRHIPKCANIINKPGGIQKSKIQEKYIGTSGVKKVQTPLISTKSEMKSYQLTKPTSQQSSIQQSSYQQSYQKPSYQHATYQKAELQMKSSLLKPNMKVTPKSILRKK